MKPGTLMAASLLTILAIASSPSVARAGVPLPCDVDGDGDVDRPDIRLIFQARNTPASGPDDPRDANGDGVITLSDGRLCVLQCTLRRCTEVTPPAPAELALGLSGAVVTAGDALSFAVEVLDSSGDPIVPAPAVTLDVVPELEPVLGPTPAVVGNEIQTSADTLGPFLLTGEVDGISSQVSFVVVEDAVESPMKARYAGLGESMVDVAGILEALAEAVDQGDAGAVAQLRADLVAARDGVDLASLENSSAFSPEGGFPPTPGALAAAGFPATPDDTALGGLLDQLNDEIAALIALIDSIDAADISDAEADALDAANQTLDDLATQLAALNVTVHGAVAAAPRINRLLAALIPRLLEADATLASDAVVAGGFARAPTRPGVFYASTGVGETQSPQQFYAARRPAIFSLAGLIATAGIRGRIINQVYGPAFKWLAHAAIILTLNDLLGEFLGAGGIEGLITGASLSIHVFNQSNSVLEAAGLSVELDRNNVFLVGPNQLNAVQGFLSSLVPGDIESVEDLIDFADGIANAIQNAGQQLENANQNPGRLSPGSCLFSFDPACVQLIYAAGFESVAPCGFICFTSPVLIVAHNRDGALVSGVFNFLEQ